MHHDWIFDVLSDLHDYATRNDLPGLAEKAEEAMLEARREIAEAGSVSVPLTFGAGRQTH
ncbi:hypothetical protein [Tabrizicola sp.]|uniref:hypothetical protein n=1 Tax=Tabrizicola sp. TaxID=2005166 RepID=UPI003F3B540D